MKNLPLLLSAILLAGCGVNATPEVSDIKDSLDSQLGGCKYAKTSDVKKLNGRDLGSGRYSIEQEFSLEILPLGSHMDEYEKLMVDKTAFEQIKQSIRDQYQAKEDLLTAELSKLKTELTQHVEQHEKWLGTASVSDVEIKQGIEKYSAKREEYFSKIRELEVTIRKVSDNFAADMEQQLVVAGYSANANNEWGSRHKKLLGKMVNEFDSTCNQLTSRGKSMVLQVSGLEPGSQMKALAKGEKKQFAGTVTYTKTEKGWMP